MTRIFTAITILAESPVRRFPRPEFDTGYQIPIESLSAAASGWWTALDVTVLLAALVFAAYSAVFRRSRRAMLGLTIFSLGYFGFWRGGCVCPVGALQNVSAALFASGAAAMVVTVFFLAPLFFALFFGRVFCGGVCPLGAMQDLVGFKPVRIPLWLEHALGMIPFIILGLAVMYAALGSGFIICRYDPFVSFFRLSGAWMSLLAGVGVLCLGVFIARPYCRFFCPYGVLLGWCSILAWRRVKTTPDECVTCGLCADSCPYNALNAPIKSPAPGTRRAGIRRLAMMLSLTPILVLIFAGLGWGLGGVFAKNNREVALAVELSAGSDSLAVGAFHKSGESIADINRRAQTKLVRFKHAGALFGAYLGLVFGWRLVVLAARRRRDGFEPDARRCLSCGRCIEYCPRDPRNSREAPE